MRTCLERRRVEFEGSLKQPCGDVEQIGRSHKSRVHRQGPGLKHRSGAFDIEITFKTMRLYEITLQVNVNKEDERSEN